jgi:uncharacterized protein (TIGR00255 family)
MILSMTGFGKAVTIFEGNKITFEVKSLNSKQIDITLKIPSNYKDKELELRSLLVNNVIRGKVEVTLTIEDSRLNGKTVINEAAIKGYYNKVCQIAAQAGMPEPKDPYQWLFRIPDVLSSESVQINENEWNIVKKTITEALTKFRDYRQNEGKVLETFLREKIANISNLLPEIEKYEDERIEKIKKHLTEDLLLIQNKIGLDKNRLEQEMIFYIEKFDVSEEKSRLACHLDYFLQTIDPKEDNSGKKLGFIAQEIGREINTLGSKSNHSQMQKIVVMMKDELEQIKEQVLNVL